MDSPAPLFPTLAAVFCSVLITACQSSHPFTKAAPTALESRATGDPASYQGLPPEWSHWIGIDALAAIPTIDWAAQLDGEPSGDVLRFDLTGQACLFEIVHRVDELERRWFLLITSDPTRTPWIKIATMTVQEPKASVDVPVWFYPSKVTVTPAGRDLGPERSADLPVVLPRLGYTVSVSDELDDEYESRSTEDGSYGRITENYLVTTSKPMVALLALFLGIQEHDELSKILREVVDAPSFLGVLLAGGVNMNLACALNETRALEHTLVDGRVAPGVSFPAKVTLNGDPALELEVLAIEPVDPVRLVGGLIGLRAQRPDEPGESVTLTLIGAGADRQGP